MYLWKLSELERKLLKSTNWAKNIYNLQFIANFENIID